MTITKTDERIVEVFAESNHVTIIEADVIPIGSTTRREASVTHLTRAEFDLIAQAVASMPVKASGV